MRGFLRACCGLLGSLVVFCGLLFVSFDLCLIVQREIYRAAEALGIMQAGGPLAGQIKGFNYLRSPEWMHPLSQFLGAAIGYGPALIVALLCFHRLAFGRFNLRATLCGNCGSALHQLREPRCPTCLQQF
jgi:hypothetical protein